MSLLCPFMHKIDQQCIEPTVHYHAEGDGVGSAVHSNEEGEEEGKEDGEEEVVENISEDKVDGQMLGMILLSYIIITGSNCEFPLDNNEVQTSTPKQLQQGRRPSQRPVVLSSPIQQITSPRRAFTPEKDGLVGDDLSLPCYDVTSLPPIIGKHVAPDYDNTYIW